MSVLDGAQLVRSGFVARYEKALDRTHELSIAWISREVDLAQLTIGMKADVPRSVDSGDIAPAIAVALMSSELF